MANKMQFNENQAKKRFNAAKNLGHEVAAADVGTQFHQTKVRFREFSGYTRPLTYEEWMSAPDDCKAAILYVQFYDQITLAWMKTKRDWIDINDGVSEVLQYLNKNVKKIMSDSKRFTPAYIYRVAWNCLSCLCWDDPSYSVRSRIHQNETSNIVNYDGDELDLFDTLIDEEEDRDSKFDLDGRMEYLKKATQLWDVIEDMGTKAKMVAAKLLGEDSYTKSEFAKVSEEEEAEIMKELRKRLGSFVSVFC